MNATGVLNLQFFLQEWLRYNKYHIIKIINLKFEIKTNNVVDKNISVDTEIEL